MSGSKEFSWQAWVAIGGLVATLIGLWVQYSGQQEELEQARQIAEQERRESQAIIEAKKQEIEKREQVRLTRRTEIENQLESVNREIEEAEFDIRRGMSGLAFAPEDQKELALQIANEGSERKKSLLEKKEKLESQLRSIE
jgi:hypothetical protein